MTLSAMAGLGKAAKGSEGELEGAGGVGGLSGKGAPEWEGVPKAGGGRIRAVQWEANPKGGVEGAPGGVDKMSCRRLRPE